MSSAKWRPFCLGLNVLTLLDHAADASVIDLDNSLCLQVLDSEQLS